MYIHFLAHQTAQMHVKYCKEEQLDSHGNNKVIMSLGKLAFQQLEKGNLIFYEDDLSSSLKLLGSLKLKEVLNPGS